MQTLNPHNASLYAFSVRASHLFLKITHINIHHHPMSINHGTSSNIPRQARLAAAHLYYGLPAH